MKTLFIYALCEPGTRTVRYIGMTGNLNRRLKEHASESIKYDSLLGEWLRSLGSPPKMVILCETSSAFWQDDETRYIRGARALGMRLVNSTDGGEGCINPTPETRAKISATKKGSSLSPEHCAKISAALKGVPLSPEHCASISAAMKGAQRSPEHCAAMSAARKGVLQSLERRAAQSARQKGQTLTPEHCAAIGAGLKGRPKSPEHRAAIGAAQKGRVFTPERCAAIGAKTKANWTNPGYREKRAATIAASRLVKLSKCPPVV